MKQSIHVSGMTCNSCLAIVSKSIYTIQGVKDLKIDLKSGNIQLNVSRELKLDQIKKVLPLKYTPSIIFKSKNHRSIIAHSKIKRLFPLFLIFIYLFAGTLFLQLDNFNFPKLMFDFMGLFFIVFSFFLNFWIIMDLALHSHNTIQLRKEVLYMEKCIHSLRLLWV